jgi:gas vesicle protein
MNEYPQAKGTSGNAVAVGFLLGAIIGAGAALLLAPGSGTETRRRLADVGRRLGGEARRALDQANDAANGLKQDANSALAAGREAFEHSPKS